MTHLATDIKALRTRIKSVDSTLHLTKAMGLVASSKIRRAAENMSRSRQYSEAVAETVRKLSSSPSCRRGPYLSSPGQGMHRIIVIAGDRGMAGGYNSNVFRAADSLAGETISFLPIGKRACDRYGKGFASSEKFSFSDAKTLADSLCEEFLSGKTAEVEIIYTRYVSIMSQIPVKIKVLPLPVGESSASDMIFEPDEESVLKFAVPEYVAGLIYASVRESFASEVTARRMAMDSAGKNAQQMIDSLSLQYNRARQSAITQEITEIVAGSGD